MTVTEIHELTDAELVKSLDDDKRELLNLRIQARTGQLENTARIRIIRREIARLKTESNARARSSITSGE